MSELVILQRLFSSGFRMLACRREADPRVAGCSRVSVRANGVRWLLCPERVDAFMSGPDGVSLAGLACD